MAADPAAAAITLRCYHCWHRIDELGSPVHVIGAFRKQMGSTLLKLVAGAATRRCRQCGWVTIFAVLDAVRDGT
ncbi:MAG: hypothetical protein ACRELA_22070 [Candidatus Rokuibacteriota bacterium]